MSTSLYCYGEQLIKPNTYKFGGRFFHMTNYNIHAWFANVRNYSAIQKCPHTIELNSLPNDCSQCLIDIYNDFDDNLSYLFQLNVTDLLNYDYTQIIEDRRINNTYDQQQLCKLKYGSSDTYPIGLGVKQTLHEYLNKPYFNELDLLTKKNIDRLIFWFD